MFKIKRDESQPLRFEIKHNKILEVEKFDSKEDGIISDGLDCMGQEIYIKNLDAGKAKELMRVVLEDDYYEWGRRWMIILIWVSWIVIFFAILYFVFSAFGGKEESSTPSIPFLWQKTEIKEENIVTQSGITQESERTENVISQSGTTQEEEKEKTEMETYFEMESLKLANVSERTSLTIANQNLQAQVNQLEAEKTKIEAEKTKLEAEKTKIEEEMKKYNAVTCSIGAEVQKKCKKLTEQWVESECAQLFLNAIP